jgi:hypothetical protein
MMSKTLLITLWLSLWACCSGFVVVGHRGDPLTYPEETFQSDSAAFAAGADYVELDVQVAKDGTLVIQHDPTLLRTTGSDVTIASSNYSQIQQYHTKNGEPIHSLQALFTHYQQSNAKFLIETKIEKGVPASPNGTKNCDFGQTIPYGKSRDVSFVFVEIPEAAAKTLAKRPADLHRRLFEADHFCGIPLRHWHQHFLNVSHRETGI